VKDTVSWTSSGRGILQYRTTESGELFKGVMLPLEDDGECLFGVMGGVGGMRGAFSCGGIEGAS
jgi:hypothetical protein